jgi:Uma2 family endonuclease
MAVLASKLLNADEFYQFVHKPKNSGRYFELERGEVIELPPPGFRHGFVCANTAYKLSQFAYEVERGIVCTNDTGVIVEEDPDTVRGADVSYYDDDSSYETVEIRYARKPPLLVAEILSPDDRISRVLIRTDQYLKCGVALFWLIDPDSRTLTVYRKGREPVTLYESDELTGEDVLKGFRCRVADLFAMPGAKKSAKTSGKNGKRPPKPKGKRNS